MGAGKTVVGALVAQRSGAQFYDLDTMVEDKAGMSIAELFATHSEDAFRAFEKETLPTVLKPGVVVALGGGVVMDDDNWRLLVERAVTVYIEVPFPLVWERIAHLPGRPLILRRQETDVQALYESRLTRYKEATHRVDGSRPPGQIADEVLQLWSA